LTAGPALCRDRLRGETREGEVKKMVKKKTSMSRKKWMFMIIIGGAMLALCGFRFFSVWTKNRSDASDAYVEQGRAVAGEEAAIDYYTRALKLNPRNDEAYFYRGMQLSLVNEDYDRAIADFTRAIELKSDNSMYYYYAYRGDAYRKKGYYDQAIADYTSAIGLNPSSDNYKKRGDAYRDKGDYALAVADYDGAIAAIDEHIAAQNRLFAERPELYESAPDHTESNNERASVVADKEILKETIVYNRDIEKYTGVIRLNPGNASAYIERGNAYCGKEDYDKAIADYTEAIRLQPGNATAYSGRGSAYSGKRDYNKAIADHTEAIRLQPGDVNYYRYRAEAYARAENYARASEEYTRLIKLDPKKADYHNFYANAYAKLEDSTDKVEKLRLRVDMFFHPSYDE
jgi:tetratricopeptide (TPR) repeat protein